VTLGSETFTEWLVLLEAADTRGQSTIEWSSLARLVHSWATPVPTALYSPSRYALQVPVTATDPPSALSTAISLWKDSLHRSGLPQWPLVRAEVMTPEELELELQVAKCAGDGHDAPPQAPLSTPDVVADDLLRRALHDSGTGLPNRELFLDRVRRALATAMPAPAVPAIILVHVDGLDTVDRSLGCPASDDTLVEIAGRLGEVVRRDDTVARVGAAALAVLVEAAGVNDTECVARRIVDLFRCRSLDEGHPLPARASVGVAMASSTDDPDQLILMAEMAVAAAKDAGGDCHKTFASNPGSV
jgi:diguanylate cyclase (GGDEF)-like protein